ncbi:hypothetical protein FB446DRAFT_649935 [Lentinula raphanica]|nr:hypothetical protein FB446DRAFT_649935 [Lentinula raphanica]
MALGITLFVTRTVFHVIYRSVGGLASVCWKSIYLFTLLSLATLPLLRFDTVLRPFCLTPGLANISLCSSLHSLDNQGRPLWADFPRLMNAQSLTFEQLLDNSVGGSGLSLDIKKAEMAMSDLVVLVKYSKLSSKDVLGEVLSTFAQDARRTGRGLQTLGSKVGGAVDLILSVNEYALAKLGSIASSPSFISHALVPFQSGSSLEKHFLLSFAESMNTLSTIIQCLVLLAEVELSNLDRLEEHLSLIHEIVSREDSTIAHAKNELLGEIWTWLGGNQHELNGHNAHLELLRGISGFRKQALAHVVSALQILRALSDDMQDMRERMVMPELVGSQIPLEVQISSIQHGLQRLRDSKVLAKEREDGAIRKVTSPEVWETLRA